jgi:hypothetical protein
MRLNCDALGRLGKFLPGAATGTRGRRGIVSLVSEPRAKRVVTVRVVRGKDPGASSDDWSSATPEQRMNAVWELTKLCLLWSSQGADAPRLQRSVVRIQRARR